MELVDEVEEDDILVNLIDKEVHQWICPGKVWLDTEGKRIQAHGGSIFMKKTYFIGMAKIKKKLLLVMELYSGV